MVVRGKTLINAVWANLSRWGGVRMLLGLITPGLAWSVLQTPLTRLIAICFAWVIEEVEVACVNIGLYCCYEIFMHRIVISVYPHYAPPLLILANACG